MNILLIGGTGMVGSRIANEATERGHSVTIVTRSGDNNTEKADATDTQQLAKLAAKQEAVVVAVSPPRDGSDPTAPLLAVGDSVIEAVRSAGIKRLVFVGGAGSLLLPSGSRLVDSPDFPDLYKQEALAHAKLLKMLRDEAKDLDWTYISPAAEIAPGERSGNFVLGGDDLVTDAAGESRISAEDYAVVLIDELEQGKNIRHRMTAAYA